MQYKSVENFIKFLSTHFCTENGKLAFEYWNSSTGKIKRVIWLIISFCLIDVNVILFAGPQCLSRPLHQHQLTPSMQQRTARIDSDFAISCSRERRGGSSSDQPSSVAVIGGLCQRWDCWALIGQQPRTYADGCISLFHTNFNYSPAAKAPCRQNLHTTNSICDSNLYTCVCVCFKFGADIVSNEMQSSYVNTCPYVEQR